MSSKRLAAAFAATIMAVGGALVATSGSATAVVGNAYMAEMGGTQATVLGQTVTSSLTAQSRIQGFAFPAAQSNNVAAVHSGTLLNVGAVTTSVNATNTVGNWTPHLPRTTRTGSRKSEGSDVERVAAVTSGTTKTRRTQRISPSSS